MNNINALFALVVSMAFAAETTCSVNKLFLVASASANTGAHVVEALSKKGFQVRAMVRDPEGAKAKELATLSGVTVVKANFDEIDTISSVLQGVDRALLVSPPFDHRQFDRETDFLMEAKKAGLEGVVRISTASFLIHPGTPGAYGRAHHGIESFADFHHIPTIHVRSNWFMSNWLLSSDEIKSSGTVTLPTKGDGAKMAMVDPRDVASASAHILTLPADQFQTFVQYKLVEVHGPEMLSFADKAAALSKAVGYEVKINPVPADAFTQAAIASGMPRVFARSYCNTIGELDGAMLTYGSYVSTTSPHLTASGWTAQHTLENYLQSVKHLFAR